MQFNAIYHRPKGNFAYAYNEDTVHIRIQTAKADIKKCYIIFGDKYDWAEQHSIKSMTKLYSDELFDYWQANIVPYNRRLCYMFLFESKDDEKYWYTEYGFHKEQPVDVNFMFEYPYLHKIDIFETPNWVKDAVFYQIFPERFANGDTTNDPEIVEKWGSRPTRENFFGGDLRGIIDKLHHLEDLGVTAIYLTPIFEANTNHKYDTKDYMKVDPHFGDIDTLKELVSKCHDRGIRVILDAVFNHSGYYFPPFQDVLKKGPDSKYWDWFHIHGYPIKKKPRPNYDTFAFEYHMPKLNTENPEVKRYLLDVAEFWIRETDIDGWRLDVANEVDHAFWREFRQVVKAVKPDAYILGEVWHDAGPWLLQGDQFDGVMNYPFTNTAIEFFCKRSIDAREFTNLLNKFMFRYPHQTNQVLLNILDSHDTKRLLTQCQGNKELFKLAVLFQMTYIGVPCIYYGDEVGMEGLDDPDCRRPMIWDENSQDRDILNFYKKCIALRKRYRALRRGHCRFIYAQESQLVMKRYTESEELLIAFNVSNSPAKIDVFIDKNRQHNIRLDPYGYEVIYLDRYER
ncbi:MAG TPA: alpha-glycosidase [Clostridiales bacterium]|nr:alpha-glycosidase [Clostridiales bacterium]